MEADKKANAEESEAGAEVGTDFNIRTPWEEMMELFRKASLKREETKAKEEYVSCIKINGRPILPPLMTPEKRSECRSWREKAIEVEHRVQQRLQPPYEHEDGDDYEEDEEDEEESESEPVVFSRSASSIAGGRGPAVADMTVATPFKSLIHRLRQDVKGAEVAAEAAGGVSGTSQYDSTMSVNTVVENPRFSPRKAGTPASEGRSEKGAASASEEPPPPSTPFRQRTGSYTLTEPSPVLRAYIDKYGGEGATPAAEGIVPHSRSASALSSIMLPKTPPKGVLQRHLPLSGESRAEAERGENLDAYLERLATMPLGLNSTSDEKKHQPEHVEGDTATQARQDEKPDCETELRQGAVTTDPMSNLEDFSVASSAINSVSIALPSARSQQEPTPQPGAVLTCPNSEVPTPQPPPLSSSALPPSITPSTSTEITQHTAATAEAAAASSVDVASRQIEVAVSRLARTQQAQIELLLQEQERQREELRRAFEEQQKVLMSQILAGMELQKSAKKKDGSSEALAAMDPAKTTGDLPEWAKRGESTTLTVETVDTNETPVESAREAAGSVSPVVPAVAAHLRPVSTLPEGYTFPAEALAPEMQPRFSRLTAVARGHLTRRLLSTHKVEGIISSIRDTMNTALLLHREATATPEDVELHRRLLLQLNKDYATLHQVFVESSPQERAALLALDRELRARHEDEKENEPAEQRRLSAATRARLAHREKMANMADSADDTSPTRRRRWKSQGRGEYHPVTVQCKAQGQTDHRSLAAQFMTLVYWPAPPCFHNVLSLLRAQQNWLVRICIKSKASLMHE